ncbi:MAG: hypothetical protein HQK77_13175 [Desulfobacterales bacterium]|nr:hypothetical protein [Desulfobacterales bacterium]
MPKDFTHSQLPPPTENTPFRNIFARLYWMAIGPVVFILFSINLIIKNNKPVVLSSIILWLIVISVIVCRYIDIRYLNGLTSEGEPATLNDWRKYSLFLSLLAVLIWVIILFLHFFI